MFYEERLINGVLMFKSSPGSEWEPLSHAELSKRLVAKDAEIKNYKGYIQLLENKLEYYRETA